MRPQVTITRLDPEDPRMLAWVIAMPRLGGGGPKVSYGSGLLLLVEKPITYGGGLCL